MKIKFYYIYILFSSKDKKLYIGFSEDLKARLVEHLRGRVGATRNRLPLILIYYEAFTNGKDAKTRERFLKSGFGRSQLKKALKNRFRELGYKNL
jgi:putative endonuclease